MEFPTFTTGANSVSSILFQFKVVIMKGARLSCASTAEGPMNLVALTAKSLTALGPATSGPSLYSYATAAGAETVTPSTTRNNSSLNVSQQNDFEKSAPFLASSSRLPASA